MYLTQDSLVQNGQYPLGFSVLSSAMEFAFGTIAGSTKVLPQNVLRNTQCLLLLKLSTCAIAQASARTVITHALLVVMDRVIATSLVATVMTHWERVTVHSPALVIRGHLSITVFTTWLIK